MAFVELSADQLIDKIRVQTGIDPLTMFRDTARFTALVLKVFQDVMTVKQFERYLTQKKPAQVSPVWLGERKVNWQKILAGGIAYGGYRIENKSFEIVPRIGMSLEEMADWPYERFVDPADTRILPQDIEADIIAIRRQNTFQVIAAGFLGPETAVPFYDGRSHLSYIWVGTRRIGQEIKTDGLTCPARKGVNFLASLKYDPKNASLKVLLSYVDFFDPEMRYVPIQVTLNSNDIIWEGHTDPGVAETEKFIIQ